MRKMTRKELIHGIFEMANFKPSIIKLATMPLENLKELYCFMFYGPDELNINGEV